MASASSSRDQSPPPSNLDGVASRIECPVCCEIFRTPKCLTCGHSVCADCCQKLLPMLGSQISCPVCRRPTVVPSTGLPTNFALQDLIQHCQSRNDQKRYRCAECDRLCTADEAWLVSTKADVETAPRCFRCIIVKQAANDSASTLPEAMESVTDTFKRHDSDLSRLRRRMETFSNEQREWANSVQQAAWNMKSRVDDIVQASQALAKATLEDVDKLNNEFQLLNVQTNSVNVPESLEGLGPFKQSIQDTSSKLDQLAEARRRTITRANVALNSLAIGLDCLLNAGDDLKANREDGAGTPGMVRGDADGFVTPPQERATDQQLAADTLGPNGTPMASPTSSSAFQGASAAGATGQRENVFSVRGSPRGQYRVYAVRVTRRRPARGGLARPSPPPNP